MSAHGSGTKKERPKESGKWQKGVLMSVLHTSKGSDLGSVSRAKEGHPTQSAGFIKTRHRMRTTVALGHNEGEYGCLPFKRINNWNTLRSLQERF